MYKSLNDQDQRAARLLTALAFFMTAGVALLNSNYVRGLNYEFANGAEANLVSIFLGIFLTSVSVAAVYLVLSIGPSEPWDTTYKTRPSHLNFSEIAEGQAPTVEERLRAAEAPDSELIDAIRDAARRTKYKYNRVMEARAAFLMGIPCLIVALILMVDAHSSNTMQWTWKLGSICGIVVAVVTFIVIEDRSRSEPPIEPSAGNTFQVIAVCFGAFSGLAFASSAGGHATWPAIVPNIAGLAATAAAAWALHIWRVDRQAVVEASRELRVLDLARPSHFLCLGLVQLGIGFVPSARVFQMAVSAAPLLGFEGIRLLDFFNWTRRTLLPGGGVVSDASPPGGVPIDVPVAPSKPPDKTDGPGVGARELMRVRIWATGPVSGSITRLATVLRSVISAIRRTMSGNGKGNEDSAC